MQFAVTQETRKPVAGCHDAPFRREAAVDGADTRNLWHGASIWTGRQVRGAEAAPRSLEE